MIISEGYYKGIKCYTIENSELTLVLLPELGAKIASLFYKPQNFEVFFQPTNGSYQIAKYGEEFAKYDTSGADEMFPTIDVCCYPYEGYKDILLPDHGELWSIPWDVSTTNRGIISKVNGIQLPYIFKRNITLRGSTVHIDYLLINKGVKPLYGLWAFHGLTSCDESTKIYLDKTVQNVINVHNSTLLGSVGTHHNYPNSFDIKGDIISLDRISPKTTNKTEKFYVKGPLNKGIASLTLNRGRILYTLVFPEQKVPYLGVWINEGGFKGEYNCALEPSTGLYDSLEITKEFNSIQPIQPGQTMEWYLDIIVETVK